MELFVIMIMTSAASPVIVYFDKQVTSIALFVTLIMDSGGVSCL